MYSKVLFFSIFFSWSKICFLTLKMGKRANFTIKCEQLSGKLKEIYAKRCDESDYKSTTRQGSFCQASFSLKLVQKQRQTLFWKRDISFHQSKCISEFFQHKKTVHVFKHHWQSRSQYFQRVFELERIEPQFYFQVFCHKYEWKWVKLS